MAHARQDPRIANYEQRFGAVSETGNLLLSRDYRGATDVKIRAVDENGHKIPYNVEEGFTNAGNYQIWAFVPNPYVMRVPRAR